MIRPLHLLVAIVLLSGAAHMADAQTALYVDAARGDDATPRAANSAAKPWRTIARAAWGSTDRNKPDASQAARPGDTVYVAAGTYSMSANGRARNIPLYNPVNSGEPDRPIAFRAQGRVVLQSQGYLGPIIGTYQRRYIVWDGFSIDESDVSTTPDTGPVVVWASQFVTIENLDIVGRFAPYIDNHNGIRLEAADDNVIRNNTVSGFGVMRNGQQERPRNSTAVTLYDSNRNVIEHNEFSECGVGVFIKAVKIGRGQDGNIVRFNSISKMGMGALGVGVIVQTSSNARVYQNLFFDLDVALEIESLARDGHPDNDVIANNTIYNMKLAAIRLRGPGNWVNVRIFNNVVARSRHVIWSEDSQQPGDLSFQHNIYGEIGRGFASLRNAEYGFADWKRSFTQDSNANPSLMSTPRFASPKELDLRLCTGPGQPVASCTDATQGAELGVDILDLDQDGSQTDAIRPGAYITGRERVGRVRVAGSGAK